MLPLAETSEFQPQPGAAPMRDQVLRLEAEMRNMPQIELETLHHYADGMYARVVLRPAGVTIVGKVHKKEHFYIVAKGCVRVTTDDGVKDLPAGSVLVSKPGTKRAVFALEDSICLTVHRTDKTDPAQIEAELIEPDEAALFNSSNKLLGGKP
jgi:quercetin dioxygenase-like cupin family protein